MAAVPGVRPGEVDPRRLPSVLLKGTQRGDATFAQAAAQAPDGATGAVQPGTGSGLDVGWIANEVAIEAPGGPAIHDDSGDTIGNKKGTLDVLNDYAVVRGLTFEDAHDHADGHDFAGREDPLSLVQSGAAASW